MGLTRKGKLLLTSVGVLLALPSILALAISLGEAVTSPPSVRLINLVMACWLVSTGPSLLNI